MNRAIWIAIAAAAMLSFALPNPARAETRAVTLGVNMYCSSCAYVVRRSLSAVPGVEGVIVSRQRQSAMVLYDDTLTEVSDLVAAPKAYGYETTVLSGVEASLRDPRGAPTNLTGASDGQGSLWTYLKSLLAETGSKSQ